MEIDARGIIRNKTHFKSHGINDEFNDRNRMSFSLINRNNRGKTLDNSNKKSAGRIIELQKLPKNNSENKEMDLNKIIKDVDLKDYKQAGKISPKKFVKYLKTRNELEILESQEVKKNQNIITNTNQNDAINKELKYLNVKDFQSLEILKFNNNLMIDNNNEEEDIKLKNDFPSKNKKNKLIMDEKFPANCHFRNEQLKEKKVLIPLKNFIRKYDFIHTEEEGELKIQKHKASKVKATANYQEKFNDDLNINYNLIEKKYEINDSSEYYNKYSLSNDDLEIKNVISDENLHKITVKNSSSKSILTQINPNDSFSFDLSEDKKFGKQIKTYVRKLNSTNFNLNWENSNLDTVEKYFRELDFKYSKTEEKDKIENPNIDNNDDNPEENDKGILNEEFFEIKKEKSNYKIKINGDQVFLKSRKNDKNIYNNCNNKN
jgi:hypothetical protein